MSEPIEAAEFDSYLSRVQNSLEREPMPEAMDLARQAMQEGQRSNFNRQATREGTPWAARKPPTGGWPILNKTGALQAAATGAGSGAIAEVDGRSAAVGVDAGVHVAGGGVHAAGFHQGGAARMPARPWLGAPDRVEEAIGEIIADEGIRFF
jgi:phage gpG-like protein